MRRCGWEGFRDLKSGKCWISPDFGTIFESGMGLADKEYIGGTKRTADQVQTNP
jgi:hypothetical protein